MKNQNHSLRTRLTALLLALICVFGLFPTTAFAAADTIKLKDFGMSGVAYQSKALGRCTLHQMYYENGSATTVGFCGTKGGGMGNSLKGQTWGNKTEISDATVKTMMAYFYAHANGKFTDEAHALGVDNIWGPEYCWYMNAWVQACIWRYQQGSMSDPVVACAEEYMAVYNTLEGTHYTSIDDELDGKSFRDRTQFILDLGAQGVWGDCKVYLYSFTGSGSQAHPASSVQKVILGELEVTTVTEDKYSLTVKKVDSTNPSKGLSGAKFHVQSENGAFSKDVVTGADGTYTIQNLEAGTYAVTETEAPAGYKIDNAGPQYVTLPSNGNNTVTVTFTDTPEITGEGSIRKVDADDPTKGLAGAIIKITGVDNNFSGTFMTREGGYITDIPWDTMPVGSYTAEEMTPPEGYTKSLDQNKVKQTFVWDGKTDVSLIFENDAKVKVRLIKLDDSGNPLPGAVFNIIKDGQIIGTEATQADGSITVTDVTEGMYAFVEVSAPAPYAKLDAPVFAHVDQATINGGGTVTVTASDKKLPNLTILKRDAKTKEVIPGTHFEIKGIHLGYHNDVTTGPDGTATLTGIPVDSYEVTEKSVPDPYVVSDEPTQTIWLEAGDSKQLIFDNQKQPLLKITKIEKGTNKPIPGTVFTVKAINGDYQDDWTTGADGKVSLRIAPGTYQITEKSVPAPYYLPDKDKDRVQTISLNPGDEKTLVFRNHKAPELTIYKEDSVAGAPIEGAKFHVTYTSNGESADAPASVDFGYLFTDAKGEIRLHETGKKLYPGEYTITEVEPAPGYQMKEPTTQRVIIRGGESKTVTFQNTPLNAIIVEKYDSVTHEALPGCTFQLRFLGGTSGTGGTVISQKTTGQNGTCIWTGLTAGTYVVEEIDPADGYSIINSSETVYLADSGEQSVVTVKFDNSPDGILLIRKVCSVNPSITLQDAEFKIMYADGTLIGDSNGIYRSDENGEIRIEGLKPGKSVVVTEVKAPAGFLIDTQSQTVQIKEGRTVSLTFKNQPTGKLIIQKRDSITGQPLPDAEFRVTTAAGCEVGLDGVIGTATLTQNGLFKTDSNGEIRIDALTKEPLAGVKFKITYADGSNVDLDGGKISSNGLYTTNAEGQIVISGITGTVIVTELEALPGYVLDPNARSQTVQINPNDTQTLTFENTPMGGLTIIKKDEETGERISGVQFEVRRLNGEVVGTYTTDRTGVITLPQADKGWYQVTELKAAKGYRLDSQPYQIEVKDGGAATLEITNRQIGSAIIRKVDSFTGEGIYGVKFLISDATGHPVGTYESDNEGYVYIERELPDGKYTARELECADGYILDTVPKTFYVEYGGCTTITWPNTAVRGQIQIVKKSADYNSTNGLPAGTLLEGAEFEICNERTGNKVDTIVTGPNGLASSKQLPLGRYTIREIKAPANYGVSTETYTAVLEHSGQIVKLEITNKSMSTGVSITKTGPKEAMSGQPVRYVFSKIGNSSNVMLQSFYWRDTLPAAVRLTSVVTGTYNFPGTYKIVYKTNTSGDYLTLADSLSTSQNYTLAASPVALGLASNEQVTEIMFVFGQVPGGFSQVEAPMLHCTAVSGLSAGSSFANVSDVGGTYNGVWVQAVSRWVTTIYGKKVPAPKLPRTGY